MIQIDSTNDAPGSESNPKVLLIGLGGAGMNVLDRAALDGLDKAQIVALNTDIQSLTASVAGKKIQLGRTVTRGLGTGGDPELGFEAAEEAQGDIEALLDGASIVFIATGLGGGTGSGVAPMLAKLAKEAGAVVFVFATLPFKFEGRRRNLQAEESLKALEAIADSVVCFENDRMADASHAKAGIHEAFAGADTVVSQSIRSVIDFIQNPGFVKIGVADLLAALRNFESRCVFGYGQGEGASAAHDALVGALKSPLMDRGKMLESARSVVVHVAGGPDMTLVQVQMLMTELGRHINDETQILLGASVRRDLAQRIRVTIISSFGSRVEGAETTVGSQEKADTDLLVEVADEPSVAVEASPDNEVVSVQSEPSDDTLIEVEPEPVLEGALEPQDVDPSSDKADKAAVKQEAFEFEPVKRGRFEKSEPTIEDGEDLDVPAFMRKKGI